MKELVQNSALHTLIKEKVKRLITGRGLSGSMTCLNYGEAMHTVQIAPNSFTALGDYSLCCNRMRELILPEGVKTLGRAALQSCPDLTHLSLPSTFVGFTGMMALTFDRALSRITYRGLRSTLQALIDPATWTSAEMGTNRIECLDGELTVDCWRAVTVSAEG
jgi:hypothetical protein